MDEQNEGVFETGIWAQGSKGRTLVVRIDKSEATKNGWKKGDRLAGRFMNGRLVFEKQIVVPAEITQPNEVKQDP